MIFCFCRTPAAAVTLPQSVKAFQSVPDILLRLKPRLPAILRHKQRFRVGSGLCARNAALPKKLIAEFLLHIEIRHELNE
jgi:hypothetical protein